MWNELENENGIKQLMEKMQGFHDTCIKEMRYISGAYVNKDLSMYPVNSLRELEIVFQVQRPAPSAIAVRFVGVNTLHLSPADPIYTCEILSASMFTNHDKLYWAVGEPDPCTIESYNETWICAEKAFWQDISDCMGDKRIYFSPYDFE